MSIATVDAVYAALARAVDEAGEERAPTYPAERRPTQAKELDAPDRQLATRARFVGKPRGVPIGTVHIRKEQRIKVKPAVPT